MNNSLSGAEKGTFAFRFIYFVSLFMLYITGFGQLPIFKRYYLADVPGFGWLAQFYITHYLHYLFAILFMGMAGYAITLYIIRNRQKMKITAAGYFRGAVLTGLVVTGLILVIKNFTGVWWSPNVIIGLDLAHIGLVMVLLFGSLFGLIFKWEWIEQNQAGSEF